MSAAPCGSPSAAGLPPHFLVRRESHFRRTGCPCQEEDYMASPVRPAFRDASTRRSSFRNEKRPLNAASHASASSRKRQASISRCSAAPCTPSPDAGSRICAGWPAPRPADIISFIFPGWMVRAWNAGKGLGAERRCAQELNRLARDEVSVRGRPPRLPFGPGPAPRSSVRLQEGAGYFLFSPGRRGRVFQWGFWSCFLRIRAMTAARAAAAPALEVMGGREDGLAGERVGVGARPPPHGFPMRPFDQLTLPVAQALSPH